MAPKRNSFYNAAKAIGSLVAGGYGMSSKKFTSKGRMIRYKNPSYVAGVMNPKFKAELKCFDVSSTNNLFTTAGNVALVNGVLNGPEEYNRIGRKIAMKSLHIRGAIFVAATGTQDVGRVLVVYDRQTNGALPPLASLLQDSNPGAATNVQSEINIGARARFQILKDYQVYLPSVSLAAGVITNNAQPDAHHPNFNINWFIPLKGLESVYSASTGVVADIVTGSIFVYVVSSNAGTYNFSFASRLRFYD